jgi:hypothetical protein
LPIDATAAWPGEVPTIPGSGRRSRDLRDGAPRPRGRPEGPCSLVVITTDPDAANRDDGLTPERRPAPTRCASSSVAPSGCANLAAIIGWDTPVRPDRAPDPQREMLLPPRS